MTTAKQKYVSKALARKYGVVGVIAGKYVEAGYSIEMFHSTRYGPIQILARKGATLAIEVFSNGTVTLDSIKAFHEKAKLLKARPVIVLYGNGVKLSEDAKSYCDQNNILVRKVL